jgi:hypothetical protein
MSYSIAVQQLPGNAINGVVVADNYIDASNAFGPFYTSTGSNLTFSGNVDLTSGVQIASPAGVHGRRLCGRCALRRGSLARTFRRGICWCRRIIRFMSIMC